MAALHREPLALRAGADGGRRHDGHRDVRRLARRRDHRRRRPLGEVPRAQPPGDRRHAAAAQAGRRGRREEGDGPARLIALWVLYLHWQSCRTRKGGTTPPKPANRLPYVASTSKGGGVPRSRERAIGAAAVAPAAVALPRCTVGAS